MSGKPVSSGQRIGGNFSASDWNNVRARSVRAAARDAAFVALDGVDDAVDGIVTVKNGTGLYLVPGSIVGLDAPFILPSQNLREFKSTLQFTGVVPTEEYAGRFGILLDGCPPATPNGPGLAPATVHGLAWANLEMQAATDKYADVYPENTNTLKSGSAGAAQILYHFPQGSTYPQQTVGYVRLSNRAAASGGVEIANYSANGTQTITTSTKYLPFIGESYQRAGIGTPAFRDTIDVQNGSTYSGELVFSRPGAYRFDLQARMQPLGTLTSEVRCLARFWRQTGGTGDYSELGGPSVYFSWPSGASSGAVFEASSSNVLFITANTRITLQAARTGGSGNDIGITSIYVLVTYVGDMTQAEYSSFV